MSRVQFDEAEIASQDRAEAATPGTISLDSPGITLSAPSYPYAVTNTTVSPLETPNAIDAWSGASVSRATVFEVAPTLAIAAEPRAVDFIGAAAPADSGDITE